MVYYDNEPTPENIPDKYKPVEEQTLSFIISSVLFWKLLFMLEYFLNFFHNTLCLRVFFSASLSNHKANVEHRKFLTPGGGEKVDIVAIGDSQTWGINTSRYSNWPGKLSVILNQPIYNMSVGGYGPAHYRILALDSLERFSPKLLIIGVYMGNDLYGAYHATTNYSRVPKVR